MSFDVEQTRVLAASSLKSPKLGERVVAMRMRDACDEIERLKAQVAKLREALSPTRIDGLICGWSMLMGHSFTEVELNSLVDTLANLEEKG